MSWSKTNKNRKSLGWWYHKIMFEFARRFKGSTSNMYYHHLLSMSVKYGLNPYGQKITEAPSFCIDDKDGIPSGPIGYTLNIYLDKNGIDESMILPSRLTPILGKETRCSIEIQSFITADELPLQQQPAEAIDRENYEEAARIRDKMNEQ